MSRILAKLLITSLIVTKPDLSPTLGPRSGAGLGRF